MHGNGLCLEIVYFVCLILYPLFLYNRRFSRSVRLRHHLGLQSAAGGHWIELPVPAALWPYYRLY